MASEAPNTETSMDQGDFCESTPGISKRKRKITLDSTGQAKTPVRPMDWSLLSPVPIFEPRGLLSSTHNESFANNFEHFTIDSKGDNSVWLSTSNTSVPTTPTKYGASCGGLPNTSSASSKLPPSTKLGSPERNAILYSTLRSTRKPKSPFKHLEYSSRNYSPAKKRLFAALRIDPCTHLNADSVAAVYAFLDGPDLDACANVSRLWRRCVRGDSVANGRLERYRRACVLNKENCVGVVQKKAGVKEVGGGEGGVVGEGYGKILQCYSISRTLTADQSLRQCVNCQQVAIVSDSISQCQNNNCAYIKCLKCDSFSASGYENFRDKCRQMRLEIDVPEHITPEKRRNTFPASINLSHSQYFSTSLLTSNSNSNITNNASNSSGYVSDFSRSTNGSVTSTNASRRLSGRMSEVSRNWLDLKRAILAPSSLPNQQRAPKLRLVPLRGRESVTPPSPPPSPPSPSTYRPRKQAVRPKSSKKSLRRLLL